MVSCLSRTISILDSVCSAFIISTHKLNQLVISLGHSQLVMVLTLQSVDSQLIRIEKFKPDGHLLDFQLVVDQVNLF